MGMQADEFELIERLHRENTKSPRQGRPSSPRPRQTIHYTELVEDTSDTPAARDWNRYRREVGRLLAQGHEGKWVLIKGGEIVGIWDTEEEANRVRLQKFLMQDVLIHQVLTNEPVLRGPTNFSQWPS
jgi:hypothetical protein